MKYIFYTPIAIAALLCACKSSPKSTQTTDSNQIAESNIVADTPPIVQDTTEATPVDYDKVKILDTVYITNATGADTKQKPDFSSITLKYNPYGSQLIVIEATKDWLGVLEYGTRQHKINNSSSTTRWEKLYVQRQMTGKFSDLKVSAIDLNIVTQLTRNDKTDTYPDGEPINNYIEIELIDKALFEEKKLTVIEHILRDTNAITKIKGVTTLPCSKKNKVYKDNPTDTESFAEYDYYGQIGALNKFIVTGAYYEDWDYTLVDKTTGKEISVGDVPMVSPDLKHLICLYEDPYNATTELELYQIKNTVPKNMVILSFNKWIPWVEKENMFWSTDGNLYVPVVHSSVYYKLSNLPNKKVNSQYIRIKIKS